MSNNKKGTAWRLAVPPEVKCEYVGIPIGEYYTDWRVMLYAEICHQTPEANIRAFVDVAQSFS